MEKFMISPARYYDEEVLSSVLETLDVATRMYKKTNDPSFKEDIVHFSIEAERLRTRIKNHDYAVEDELYRVTDQLEYEWGKI